MARYFYSPAKQKAVLLLAAGIDLIIFAPSRSKWRIAKNLHKAWKEINRTTLRRIINEFRYSRLVDFKENKDGTVSVELTELGKIHAIRYNPENIFIEIPKKWDKKWRIVIFDVPEKKRNARDALRWEMKKLGFFELQKSVWVFPYDCKDAIDFLVELFEIRNHVRYITVERMSLDADLKLHFNLS